MPFPTVMSERENPLTTSLKVTVSEIGPLFVEATPPFDIVTVGTL